MRSNQSAGFFDGLKIKVIRRWVYSLSDITLVKKIEQPGNSWDYQTWLYIYEFLTIDWFIFKNKAK